MRERHLSFYYLNENHIPDYRKGIINYLKDNEKNIEEIGFPQLIIDFHNFSRRENPLPTGHLFIQDIEDNSNRFEEVCKYVLSRDRKFIPVAVSCRFKKDYEMLDDILKNNYGKKGRLTNGFLGLGVLSNQKLIKKD